MLAKRIIPCLDVRDGRVVKGVNFGGIKEIGDPVSLAEEYNRQGADELVFYDITASSERRGLILSTVEKTAEKVFIPLSVGGGVGSVEDMRTVLRSGADKVSVNSQAVKNPSLIKEAADVFGSQCVVVGIDAKRVTENSPEIKSGFTVTFNGGRVDAKLDLVEWAKKAEALGAGEICLNSIDADGVRGGFDIEMLNAVCAVVKIPVIASGGCGKLEHFSEVFEKTNASAALAASLFHFGILTVEDVKKHLREKNIPVRN